MKNYRLQATDYRLQIFLIVLISGLFAIVSMPAQALCCVLPNGNCSKALTTAQVCVDWEGTLDPDCSTPACKPPSSPDTGTPSTFVALPNPLGTTNVPVILGRLVATMVGFAGALGLIILVYGGFQWLTAVGNPEKIKKGQDIMFWAIVGLVVMFGAYVATRYLIAVLTQGRVLL